MSETSAFTFSPAFEDGRVTLYCGDAPRLMREWPNDYFHAVVTDPPYGLGFMGEAWDRVTKEWHSRWLAEALRVLRPGGCLVAFGGTKTHHQLWSAADDAGLEVRDTLLWLYGGGFPKSRHMTGDWESWTTVLKPAWEPILLARKPLSERSAQANLERWGTGALHTGACVMPGPPGSGGRWPANAALDEEAAAMLDEQSGERGGPWSSKGDTNKGRGGYGGWAKGAPANALFHGDTGGASRFFYCPKASVKERGEGNDHPTVKPLALMRWLVRLVTAPGGVILDPFVGSGTTALACVAEDFKCCGLDTSERYIEIAKERLAQVQ